MKLSFPNITYCGINYGHTRWNRHMACCDICRKRHEIEKLQLILEWNKTCECGCGNITQFNKKYIVGHNSIGKKRTEEQKKNYRNSFTLERREKLSKNAIENNCMYNKKTVEKVKKTMIEKYGVDNISKTQKFKNYMLNNNPMHNKEIIKKHKLSVNTDKFREHSKKNWIENNPSHNIKSLEKRINTYSERLSEGKYTIKNRWKTGYFIKKDGSKEWYDSSLELEKMKYYESLGIKWTKKHGIKIKYKNNNGLNTYYIPDFLIIDKNKEILEETKGWLQPNVMRKVIAAKQYCEKNKLTYNFYLKTINNKIERFSYDYST